jgi:hypothetical protein
MKMFMRRIWLNVARLLASATQTLKEELTVTEHMSNGRNEMPIKVSVMRAL